MEDKCCDCKNGFVHDSHYDSDMGAPTEITCPCKCHKEASVEVRQKALDELTRMSEEWGLYGEHSHEHCYNETKTPACGSTKHMACCLCGKPRPVESGWLGSLDEKVRENLTWYKENGSDHGDLVIAEEAIKNAFAQELERAKDGVAGEIEEAITKDIALFKANGGHLIFAARMETAAGIARSFIKGKV